MQDKAQTNDDGREKVVYRGTPSQSINMKRYLFCVVLLIIASVMPSIWENIIIDIPSLAPHKNIYMLISKALFFLAPIWAFIGWIKVRHHIYTITNERLREEEGILSKHTDELELFRVKDISLAQPIALRMFGCGNVILDTSDKSTPIVVLHAVKKPNAIINILRKNVSVMRAKKGVREVD